MKLEDLIGKKIKKIEDDKITFEDGSAVDLETPHSDCIMMYPMSVDENKSHYIYWLSNVMEINDLERAHEIIKEYREIFKENPPPINSSPPD